MIYFSSICTEFKGITDKVVLEETLKDLRTSLDKKCHTNFIS